MKKNIYKHKETGKRVVTSETLSPEHWEQVNVIKGAKMENDEIRTKTYQQTKKTK